MASILATSATQLAGQSVTARRSAPRPAAAFSDRPQRRCLAVRAAAAPQEPDNQGGAAGIVQDFTRTAERVLARHDFLSAGMGALAVTGYCVMRGQDLGTALWITAAATVVAIVVEDMLPRNQ